MSGARMEGAKVLEEAAGATNTDPELPSQAMDAGAPTRDLKRKTARGALISVAGQGVGFVLRTGSMVVIARLVTPEQFGLVGMVTAFTGFLGLFRDVGLSMATVQRESITHAQTSTLFWINLAVGGLLAALAAAGAPVLAAFYGDPRLFWITVALGAGFIFNGASAQHRALLQRNMRFGVLVMIDIVGAAISIAVGIWMAMAGMGYWALVVMSIGLPAVSLVGVWLASGWFPGVPRRGSGIRSMLHYGGVLTINSLVVYVVYNAEKVLLGRIWGAEVLGIYGRAYQLINLPTENLNSAIGWVMFPALSRVQSDPARLRSYFLKGYSLFLSVVMPITMACGLFANDIVTVLLGPQWQEAVPVFRLLTPTILAFALINPLACLMQATGQATRSLRIAFLIAPVVVVGYVIGLPYGAKGVALGFSVGMLILVAPVIQWAKHGTLITAGDMLRIAFHPFLSTLIGAAAAFLVGGLVDQGRPTLRLTVLTVVLFATYLLVLLFALKQKQIYWDFLRACGVLPAKRALAPEA